MAGAHGWSGHLWAPARPSELGGGRVIALPKGPQATRCESYGRGQCPLPTHARTRIVFECGGLERPAPSARFPDPMTILLGVGLLRETPSPLPTYVLPGPYSVNPRAAGLAPYWQQSLRTSSTLGFPLESYLSHLLIWGSSSSFCLIVTQGS